jgi:hypothetical protein
MGLEANVIRLYRLWDCWPPCIGRICNHVGFFQLSQFQRGRAGSKRALPLVSMPRFSGLQMNFPSLMSVIPSREGPSGNRGAATP